MPYIVAEIGSNHDGNYPLALDLVEEAADCGVDAVKFQIYNPETLVHPDMPAYPQAVRAGYKKQIDRFRALSFNETQWATIIRVCRDAGVDFLATCFDEVLLAKYAPHMAAIKIASGDITHYDLIRAAAATGKTVWLSTGLATDLEVQRAAGLCHHPVVMHCVSQYPTPNNQANLGRINELKRFGRVGYSDHTIGITACVMAAAMGAVVIEKHFTDLRRDYGDHHLSADPEEMRELVWRVREAEAMLQTPAPVENPNRESMRRGAYAAKPIEQGKALTRDDLIMLRPQGGTRLIDSLIGTKARKHYEPFELVR